MQTTLLVLMVIALLLAASGPALAQLSAAQTEERASLLAFKAGGDPRSFLTGWVAAGGAARFYPTALNHYDAALGGLPGAHAPGPISIRVNLQRFR